MHKIPVGLDEQLPCTPLLSVIEEGTNQSSAQLETGQSGSLET